MNPISRREEMREECRKFNARNPEVWRLFERFAFEKLHLGYGHFSAKAIVERIRWETSLGDGAPDLKMNDHYTAFYARRFAAIHPVHAEFFRIRKQKSAEKMASSRRPPNRFQLNP